MTEKNPHFTPSYPNEHKIFMLDVEARHENLKIEQVELSKTRDNLGKNKETISASAHTALTDNIADKQRLLELSDSQVKQVSFCKHLVYIIYAALNDLHCFFLATNKRIDTLEGRVEAIEKTLKPINTAKTNFKWMKETLKETARMALLMAGAWAMVKTKTG